MPSSIQIQIPAYGYTYTFSGVLSIQHHFSLKLQTKQEAESGSDFINGARNQPDKLILNVIESDVGHLPGWSDRMIQAMESVKRMRTLCTVVTPAKTYVNMLLSEFTATVNEESQSGWRGSLTFIQATTITETKKTNDNSSTATHTGSTGTVQKYSLQEMEQILQKAGIIGTAAYKTKAGIL